MRSSRVAGPEWRQRPSCCSVFESVVPPAGPAQVGDPRAAALVPSQQLVHFIVQGVVVAAGKRAPAIPKPQPLAHRLRNPVASASDLQRRSGADLSVRAGMIRHHPRQAGGPCSAERDHIHPAWPAPSRRPGATTPERSPRPVPSATEHPRRPRQQPVSGDVRTELGQGPGFGRPL